MVLSIVMLLGRESVALPGPSPLGGDDPFAALSATAGVDALLLTAGVLAAKPGLGASPGARIAFLAAGASLSATSVEALEAAVTASPYDASGRGLLIAFYLLHDREALRFRMTRREHVMWLISHLPAAAEASDGFARFVAARDGADAVEGARAAWLQQVESHPGSTTILDHAAAFHAWSDPALAESWWRAAEPLDPGNWHWAERIGWVRIGAARRAREEGSRYAEASKALEAYQRAQRLATLREDRLTFQDRAAWAAWFVKADEKAARWAGELIKETPVTSPQYMNAMHQGWTILGLVALRGRHPAEAETCLAKSADLGPPGDRGRALDFRLDLARDLLAQGHPTAVAGFLEALARYPRPGRPNKLAGWREAIGRGESPVLGDSIY